MPVPPALARSMRVTSAVLGTGLLLGGIVLTLVTVLLGTLVRSEHDPRWVVLLTACLIPQLCILGIAACLFAVRRCYAGGALHQERARHLHGALRVIAILSFTVAVLAVVLLVLVGSTAATAATLLVAVDFVLPLVGAAVCALGFLTGRGSLRPSAALLARHR
ncbi:MAG: hypothetical protein ACRDRN_01060 [Sciscionella sp.]